MNEAMESLAIIIHLRFPLTLYVFTIRKVRVDKISERENK
jgi:hypothetical protein